MNVPTRIQKLLASALLGAAIAWPVAAQTGPQALVERGVRAGADAELLTELRIRATEAGLDAEAVGSLLTPAVTLAERGLPSRMVARKALEGLAKRVPAERIVDLLDRLSARVGHAGAVVDPWLAGESRASVAPATPAEGDRGVRETLIESAALALFHGAPETVIREVLDRVPAAVGGRPVGAVELGVGIEITPQLPLAERDPSLAAELVVGALGSGFDAAQMRELPAALEAAERRAQLPAEAVARGAMSQFRELPATDVLQNLFQGEFPGNVPFEIPPGLENAGRRGAPPPPPPPPSG